MRNPFDPNAPPADDTAVITALAGAFAGDVFGRLWGLDPSVIGLVALWGMAIGGADGLLWRLGRR